MLKVGLTGGLASGKSFIGRLFAEWGAHVIQADELGHQTLAPDGEAYPAVVREFGEKILNEDRTIDRSKLGRIVFADSERLAKLNSLVHPHVFRRQQKFFEQLAREHPDAVGVVEAAILIETGGRERYDRIVLAYCPPEVQIARFISREHASEAEARARMSRQMPLVDKIPYADYLVDTSGAKAETRERAREVYVKLEAEAAGK